MKKIILTCILLVFSGCTTTKSYIPLKIVKPKDEYCSLDIIMPAQNIEKKVEIIGNFSVQERGLSINCEWNDTLQKNKSRACNAGADGIQFISIDAPSFISSCYQTKANFFIYSK